MDNFKISYVNPIVHVSHPNHSIKILKILVIIISGLFINIFTLLLFGKAASAMANNIIFFKHELFMYHLKCFISSSKSPVMRCEMGINKAHSNFTHIKLNANTSLIWDLVAAKSVNNLITSYIC